MFVLLTDFISLTFHIFIRSWAQGDIRGSRRPSCDINDVQILTGRDMTTAPFQEEENLLGVVSSLYNHRFSHNF